MSGRFGTLALDAPPPREYKRGEKGRFASSGSAGGSGGGSSPSSMEEYYRTKPGAPPAQAKPGGGSFVGKVARGAGRLAGQAALGGAKMLGRGALAALNAVNPLARRREENEWRQAKLRRDQAAVEAHRAALRAEAQARIDAAASREASFGGRKGGSLVGRMLHAVNPVALRREEREFKQAKLRRDKAALEKHRAETTRQWNAAMSRAHAVKPKAWWE